MINYEIASDARSEVDQLPANQEESPTKEPEMAVATGPSEPEIEIAFGAATSLYERHPVSGETAGNPLADVSNNRVTAVYIWI